jgi:hypothetical protein
MEEKMINFIYDGFYYPVVGLRSIWENYRYKVAYYRRIPGYASDWYDYIPGFHVGVKCRLTNPKEPYKMSFLKKIDQHGRLRVLREVIDDAGIDTEYYQPMYENPPEDKRYMYTVLVEPEGTPRPFEDWLYVGTPEIAASLNIFRFSELESTTGKVVNIGYDPKEQKWYGWSHRAICGFGIGDRVFEADISDYEDESDKVPFTMHGRQEIKNMTQAKQAARNFAEYIG